MFVLTFGWGLVMLWFINPILNAEDEQTARRLGKTLFLVGATAAILDLLFPGIFYRINWSLIMTFTISMELVLVVKIVRLRAQNNPFCL